MEKTISAFEARRNFGKVLQDVAACNAKVIVEKHGEAVAVVVPMEVYRQWQRSRQRVIEKMREMAMRSDLSPEEADALAAEAVAWARATKDE
jgi:prevent-host-death family protein